MFAHTDWWSGKIFSKTYILSHYYFLAYVSYLVVIMFTATILIFLVEDSKSMSFLQAAFLAVSAASMTGLSPVDFAATRFATQLIVWCLILVSSPMVLTIVPVTLRVRSFQRQVRFDVRRNSSLPPGASVTHLIDPRIYAQCDEYAALVKLRWLVLLYWVIWQLIGWLVLWAILACRGGQQGNIPSACWPALFLATSVFHNAGLTTLTRGLPFHKDNVLVMTSCLMVVSVLILAGNSCFPMLLRACIYCLLKRRRHDRALELLLRDPRRCYTHLFPDYANRWLIFVTVGLVLAQVLALLVSDWDGAAFQNLPRWPATCAVLFHSISTRTAGVSVLDLSQLSDPAAFVFCVCMWISTSPVVVTMRSTLPRNELEPASTQRVEEDDSVLQSHYVISGDHLNSEPDMTQWTQQLSLFMRQNGIVLALLFFAILLAERYQGFEGRFLWSLFEFCSAWGTVGLSMSSKNYAHSGDWCAAAQLSLMAVMFLGRLRGLPSSIDPSVRSRGLADRIMSDELSPLPNLPTNDSGSTGMEDILVEEAGIYPVSGTDDNAGQSTADHCSNGFLFRATPAAHGFGQIGGAESRMGAELQPLSLRCGSSAADSSCTADRDVPTPETPPADLVAKAKNRNRIQGDCGSNRGCGDGHSDDVGPDARSTCEHTSAATEQGASIVPEEAAQKQS